MNASVNNSLTDVNAVNCIGTSENKIADDLFSVLSIILNLLSCPPTVLLNTLVIVAVKTKPRLQTTYNLLLAFMAGTDLAVGIAAQPVYIAGEIYRLAGGSSSVFCKIIRIPLVAIACLSLASLFHLMLIGVERVVAMKYPFQYDSIMIRQRLTVATVTCWLISIVHFALRYTETGEQVSGPVLFILIATFMSVIFYCHISVYLVCRRHLKQIKSEQVSSEATAKFLNDRKAWKTTTIVLGGLVLSFVPGLLRGTVRQLFSFPLLTSVAPVTFSFIMLNSLLNPIIYCWRSEVIRQALMELLGKS